MKRAKKKENGDDPKPLNFDQDEKKGPSDRLEKPFMTPFLGNAKRRACGYMLSDRD